MYRTNIFETQTTYQTGLNQIRREVKSEKLMYIDIGNSFVKIAAHDGESWIVKLRASHTQLNDVMAWIKLHTDSGTKFIAASVVERISASIKQEFSESVRFIEKDDISSDKLDYLTPETLGIDRYIACVGAYKISNTPVIVVDAGTAVTIDLMDAEGVFKGGVIAPGIELLEKGLLAHAPSLPQVERSLPGDFPPKSTTDALRWGISGSYLAFIRNHIEKMRSEEPGALIWITGGDVDILMQLTGLKLNYHPNLVFEGLRQITLNF